MINPAGLALIQQFEGLRLSAYQDQAGHWTIGYGHTGRDVYGGLTIDLDYADYLLRADLVGVEKCIDDNAMEPTANQYSAMCSLAFNIGAGAFIGSSVLRLHNKGDFLTAAEDFLLWDKAHIGGKFVTVNGLLHRRMAEMNLYLEADA